MRIFNFHSSIIGRITALVNTPHVKKMSLRGEQAALLPNAACIAQIVKL